MSTSIDRTSKVKGAGTVKLGSNQFFDKGAINAEIVTTWNDILVAGYGKYDDAKADEIVEVSFNPAGQITAAILSALYPYGDPTIDESIFGGTDTACEVHSLLGKKLTIHNAALSQMPNLVLGAQDTIFQEAQITGLIRKSMARTEANCLYTLADAVWSGTIDRSKMTRLSYTGAWGGNTITAQESWSIEFDLGLNPDTSHDIGTYDMTIGSVAVRAKCRPNNLSETLWNLRQAQGDSTYSPIGASGRQGNDLVITCDSAGGVDLTLKDAVLKEGPLAWGENELRAGEIGFEASRDDSGSVPGAIFTIAVST